MADRKEQEQQVLGGILLSSHAALCRIFLKPEDFVFPQHAKIMEAMQACSSTPDLVRVTESLIEMGDLEAVGGANYLAGLTAIVPVTKDSIFFIELTREIIKR